MRPSTFGFALLIGCAALALRVYAIDRLPPGLFGDEAVEGLDALDVLAGNWQIWFHAHLGREPLYVYLTALSYALFGVTPLATRLPALSAGLATIPAAFFLTREWAAEIFPRERATRLAWLTAALLTISFWHAQMTRNAHRDTLLPFIEAVGYFLLWRAIRTRDWRFYAGAGAVLGLAIYTYSPGRFVGVFVAVFIAVEFLIWRLLD
ncbi:MAG: glycosyltransferase family 39 protein, partial [Chloroflexota bacterium]